MSHNIILFDLPEDTITSVYQFLKTYDRARLESAALRNEYRATTLYNVYSHLTTPKLTCRFNYFAAELKWNAAKAIYISTVELPLQDLHLLTDDDVIAKASSIRVAGEPQNLPSNSRIACKQLTLSLTGYSHIAKSKKRLKLLITTNHEAQQVLASHYCTILLTRYIFRPHKDDVSKSIASLSRESFLRLKSIAFHPSIGAGVVSSMIDTVLTCCSPTLTQLFLLIDRNLIPLNIIISRLHNLPFRASLTSFSIKADNTRNIAFYLSLLKPFS